MRLVITLTGMLFAGTMPLSACLVLHFDDTVVQAQLPGQRNLSGTATKAGPAGELVALFGAGITRNDGVTRFFDQMVITSDQNFTPWSLTLPVQVPAASVWLAIRLSDGCWIVGSPGNRIVEVAFPTPPGFSPSTPPATNTIRELAVSWPHAHIMVYRPDGSVFNQRALDGSTEDFDGTADGNLVFDAEALAFIEGTQTARPVLQGDVVAVIDYRNLVMAVKEVTASDAASGFISP